MTEELSRQDFISACIRALEERPVVVDQRPIHTEKPKLLPTQSSSSFTTVLNSETEGLGKDKAGTTLSLEQTARTTVSNSTNSHTDVPQKKKKKSLLSTFENIRARNFVNISIADDINVLVTSLEKWISDFENDHRSVKEFAANFNDTAILSQESLSGLQGFCDSVLSKNPPLNSEATSLAQLCALLFLSLPRCLLHFEKFLVRACSADIFFAVDQNHDVKNSGHATTDSTKLKKLQERLLGAVECIPLNIIGKIDPAFWARHNITKIVLDLQTRHLRFCHDLAFGCQQKNISCDSLTSLWVTEFNFLKIIREFIIGHPSQLKNNLKAVIEWCSTTIMKSMPSANRVALLPNRKDFIVACVHLVSQFMADVLQNTAAKLGRKIFSNACGGHNLFEDYLSKCDVVLDVSNALVWFHLNESLLFAASTSIELASACLKVGAVRHCVAALALCQKGKEADIQSNNNYDANMLRHRNSIISTLCNFAIASISCREWLSQIPFLRELHMHPQFGLIWAITMSTTKQRASCYNPEALLHRCEKSLEEAWVDAAKDINDRNDNAPACQFSTKALEHIVGQLFVCRSLLHKFLCWDKLRNCLGLLISKVENKIQISQLRLEKARLVGNDDITQPSMLVLEALENEVVALSNARTKMKYLYMGTKCD